MSRIAATALCAAALSLAPGGFAGPVAQAASARMETRAQPTPPPRAARPAPAVRQARTAPRPVSRPPRIMTDEETRAYHRDMTNSKIGD